MFRKRQEPLSARIEAEVGTTHGILSVVTSVTTSRERSFTSHPIQGAMREKDSLSRITNCNWRPQRHRETLLNERTAKRR